MNAVGGLSSMLLAPELPDVQPTDVLVPMQRVGSRTLGLRRLLDGKRFVHLKLMDNHFAPYGFPHGACTHILQCAGHIDEKSENGNYESLGCVRINGELVYIDNARLKVFKKKGDPERALKTLAKPHSGKINLTLRKMSVSSLNGCLRS